MDKSIATETGGFAIEKGSQVHPVFHIDFRYSAGNFHITLTGEFNGMCAWELLKTIKRQRHSPDRIFINTAGLTGVMPSGAALFKSHMIRKKMPRDWLYFKGNKGFQIAPNGSRVIILKKHPNRKRFGFNPMVIQPG